MFKLHGKTAIVFGGGSENGELNNGLATALAFERSGARVAIVDASRKAVDDALARFAEEVPDARESVIGIRGDVTSESDVAAAVETTVDRLGGLDILHNNVGIARMGGPIEMGVDEWNHVLDVNLTGAFLTMKHALPHMLAQGSGAIVNVASVAGLRYIGYNYPSYSATKAGLIGLTQNVALEYAARGIRANAIAPGYMRTPMIFRQISGAYGSAEEMVRARDALSPTGAMGSPEDVANAAVFLASAGAQYVNGICLEVDGGLVQQSARPAAAQ